MPQPCFRSERSCRPDFFATLALEFEMNADSLVMEIDAGISVLKQHDDSLTAQDIATGISLQRTYGTTCAVEFLSGKGIPAKVIQRVLLPASKQRKQG